MPLTDVMEQTTHRQYLLWMKRFDQEWNEPSRSDNYLMQIAREVHCVLMKNSANVKTSHFKMEFEKPKPVDPQEAAERDERKKQLVTSMAKAKYFAALGVQKAK